LGIEGLTNNVNLDVLTNDQLLAMGNSLLQIGASQIDYEDKMAQVKSENAVLERSNYNPYNLIGDVNDYGYTS
jgi:hypothetical protein